MRKTSRRVLSPSARRRAAFVGARSAARNIRSVVGRPVGPVGPARPVGPVPLSSPLHRPSISPTDRLRAHSSRKLDGLSGGIRAEYPARRRSARPLSRLKPRGDILSSVSICPAVATIRANIDCCTNICAVTIPLSPYISRFHAAYTYRRPAHVSLWQFLIRTPWVKKKPLYSCPYCRKILIDFQNYCIGIFLKKFALT